ncbi:hypothetical protein [Bacteroides clarus]|uniref:hypothetical protein n=1 Tax=Bacteroides clarus TaxID=626929 RepID=UPI00189C90EE|nr:hypothetical protein [Bacteroides clarus]
MKRRFLLPIVALLLMSSCMRPNKEPGLFVEGKAMDTLSQKNYEYISTLRLTVSESKRLIAKGIAVNKEVRERLENGMVIITLGTTNTYIAEELAGLDTPRGSFVTGRIYPGYKEDFQKGIKRHSEIVLIKGKMTDMSYTDALAKMEPQDIVFKGANMLNYAKRQAAVCVGAPDGGTVAKLRRYTDNGRGRWVCPVGLEKSTAQDLFEIQKITNNSSAERKNTVKLNVTEGNVYTEIEAVKEFADVDVFVTAKGGVDGAEGGVSLLVCGSKVEVQKVEAVIRQVSGEPDFLKK